MCLRALPGSSPPALEASGAEREMEILCGTQEVVGEGGPAGEDADKGEGRVGEKGVEIDRVRECPLTKGCTKNEDLKGEPGASPLTNGRGAILVEVGVVWLHHQR